MAEINKFMFKYRTYMKKLTTAEFITNFYQKYPDGLNLQLNKFQYATARNKSITICKTHNKEILNTANNLMQGIKRWYYMDSKDDIYLLFSVIKRFLMFHNSEANSCFDLLRRRSIVGIQCLIDTYESSDKDSINQTLKHYQFILENYIIFKNSDLLENNPREQVFKSINTIYDDTFYQFIFNFINYIENEKNIEHKKIYLDSILLFMKPKQDIIHKWIEDNLVYT